MNQRPLGKVLPKLSQRSPSARAKRGMWGGEKELSAFVFTRFMPILPRVYILCHLI